ncbi:MAG TPA: 16S rRNA (adenine(1518)-N(6)/adenine(1519)-N(6))-dimethyltransferase RsmA [Patescibacteria group bacterium]|nr:16S rRNA (adenine(1518)-N(6)/adenine(1519)-N(6))-dimethyltransferase RsmA [Patescibacteria group bacterium]
MHKSAQLGQNFLRDGNFARKIVGLLEAPAGPILEIGAGRGILSELLVEKFPGRPITLVEIDPLLVTELEQHLVGRAQIISGDILQIDLARMFPQTRIAVIGNLPYHISKPLVDWFIAQREKIGSAVLMLQKDFVDKLLSASGGKKYNAQSVVFQTLYQARRCFDVPAGAFSPAPKIMSTVLVAQPAPAPLPAASGEFYRFVKLCFAERRKTLWNNLAPYYEKEILLALAGDCGLSPQARAEQLPADHFPALFIAMEKSAAERRP